MLLKSVSWPRALRGSFLAMTLAAVLACPGMGRAADPTTPCDPQFMQAMQARAWLEAQREITQNQNLISKPDSVLDYSCFNQFLNVAASNFVIDGLDRQFSETNAWATTGFDHQSTDLALTNVVGDALANYLDGNFPAPQAYLGGRLRDFRPNHNVADVNGDQKYNCDVMARVWELARCQNFDSIPAQDGFHDFNWYVGSDPRQLPVALQSCYNLSGRNLDAAYNRNLAEAFNGNQAMFVLPKAADVDPDGTPYLRDNVLSYFDLILPGRCGAAILTGVQISGRGADGVCPNPGCSYIGGRCE